MQQHGYLYKIIMLKERNHKKEYIVYDSNFFKKFQKVQTHQVIESILVVAQDGEQTEARRHELFGGTTEMFTILTGTGFTAIYICQNLSNHAYVQFIACQSYLNKADLKIAYSTCFTQESPKEARFDIVIFLYCIGSENKRLTLKSHFNS